MMKKLYVSPTIESERISTPKAWACNPVNPSLTNWNQWDGFEDFYQGSPMSFAADVAANCTHP
jgi:hypothetical protein